MIGRSSTTEDYGECYGFNLICSGIRMDYLEWLDTWCSEEKYPEETLYGVIEKTGGEMPMATFPGWVKYKDGDPLKGTSYEVSYEIPEGFFDNFA